MNAATLLIKPVSGRCDLACRYCFYRETPDHGPMSAEIAEALIRGAFALGADELSFAFQGGEPTLAGLSFFEGFTEQVAAAAAKHPDPPRVRFSLQTNGVALGPDWARFLKDRDFLVGVSLDGPRLIHDEYRRDRAGAGTHRKIMRSLEILQSEGVPVNALCVVDAAAADNAEQIYGHLRSRGFDWIQFIPCIDPLGEAPGGHPWSLTPEAYGRFLKAVFDLYWEEWLRGSMAHIRWFDNLVGMAMGLPPESCGMAGVCTAGLTVEADGSVYPCDFYVAEEWRMGNILRNSFPEMLEGAVARKFAAASRHRDAACADCGVYALCRGGCRRDREPSVEGRPGLNRYCASFRNFFPYAEERIARMAAAENRSRIPSGTAAAKVPFGP